MPYYPYRKVSGSSGVSIPETWEDILGNSIASQISFRGLPSSKVDYSRGIDAGKAQIYAGTITISLNGNVTGNLSVGGNLNVTGNANITGNNNVTGNLDVTGTSTLKSHILQLGADPHVNQYVFMWDTSVTPNRWRPVSISAPYTNLVRNGSFELAITDNVIRYWTRNQTNIEATRQAGNPDNFGSYCVRLRNAIIDEGDSYSIVFSNLKADTIYTVSVKVKVSAHGGAEAQIARIKTTGGYENVDETTVSSSWTELEETFKTDTDGNDVTLLIGASNNVTVPERLYVFFDSVMVNEGGVLQSYTPL